MPIGGRLAGLRALVTGHTGFKGGWLSLWLERLRVKVHGIALAPDTTPNLFDAVNLSGHLHSRLVDIRDAAAVSAAVRAIRPDVVFHLAAQPLVRRSYREPVETFQTNVMGTVNLLEACRDVPGLRAVVCVTTDKVYENREWPWPYREIDRLGGKDPYSASKAASEIAARAYGISYFEERGVPVLTARGGNVIGGGDWAEDRIVPDIFRALRERRPLELRSPDSVRPWQHVLTLCHGYILLADAVLAGTTDGEGAWNFGPSTEDFVSVRQLVARFAAAGAAPETLIRPGDDAAESRVLTLDSSRAHALLGWKPALSLDETVRHTVDWYLAAAEGRDLAAVTAAQIDDYARRLADDG